jgi:hypothetical protein
MWMLKARKKISSNLLLFWVNNSYILHIVKNNFHPITPAILILSLPRSGSSWVGNIVGNSINAMYLREPITQSYKAKYKQVGTVFPINFADPPLAYAIAADNAFNGIPAFDLDIIRFPHQWSLLGRTRKRIVIKEVNPYACEYYIKQYHPRIIFLVRHPAGVATSYKRLNWLPSGGEDFYSRHGDFQGSCLSSAYNSLINYSDYKIVIYEQLCTNPIEVFQEIISFSDLTWDSNLEIAIRESSKGGDRSVHWTTNRNSVQVVDAWRQEINDQELENLRISFMKYDLPWFKLMDDW